MRKCKAKTMEINPTGKLNIHSIIFKFLFVFLLFGCLLVMVTVSIQNDFSRTTVEKLTASHEQQSILTLEKNLGEGEWSVRDSFLYKGDEPIGNGSYENAYISSFIQTEEETGSFVYCFMSTSFVHEAVLKQCAFDGEKQTDFLRVSGSTLDADGMPIVGKFLDQDICDALNKDHKYSGRSVIDGSQYFCYYRLITDNTGNCIGAIAAGCSLEELDRKSAQTALNSTLAICVIIVYIFVSLFLFVFKWNRSVRRMEKHLAAIGNGDYPEEKLIISGGDELSEMADVINDMKQSLIERERLRNELEFARTIQAEMLPGEDAAAKLPDSCDLTGFMLPAREVGGDLYDFFMIDETHLGLVVADVSGKGTPAALFMATAKMCIRNNMMLGAEPKDVLFRVNNQLLESSKSGLFVTAWIGELDLTDGHLVFASAGHPFPFMMRNGSNEYQQMKSEVNLVLAGRGNFKYSQSEINMNHGDRLFLYTDGLDEARDREGGFFGKGRIKEYLDENAGETLRTTVINMKAAVDKYTGDMEQFDDLTMLMVEYRGGKADE